MEIVAAKSDLIKFISQINVEDDDDEQLLRDRPDNDALESIRQCRRLGRRRWWPTANDKSDSDGRQEQLRRDKGSQYEQV